MSPDAAKKTQTLDSIVDKSSTVYFLSEVAYDAHHFNSGAYENAVEYISRDPSVKGVVVDGALTRLDRPEFLNDFLTYWIKSQEECEDETRNVRYSKQYEHMRDKQLTILEKRLEELKKKLPNAKIVLSLDSDDLQFTASARLNELLAMRQDDFNESVTRLGRKVKEGEQERRDLRKKFESLDKEYTGLKGKSNSKDKHRKEEVGKARQGMQKEIRRSEDNIKSLKSEIEALKVNKELFYRVKKTRPMHQWVTADLVNDIYERYEAICKRQGIELVKRESVLQFGSLTIDYGHNRHFTQAVIKSRDKALLESTRGKMNNYQQKALQQVKDAKTGIDVIVEGGHAGIGYKQLQKNYDHPDESNFRTHEYDPEVGDSHINVVMVLPFEDQSAIRKFMTGQEPVRMSLGKPMSTRKHSPVDRLKNNGVSGLTFIRKSEEGIIGTGWRQYQDFIDDPCLEEQAVFCSVYASADEHIGAAESNWTVQDGFLSLYFKDLQEARVFRGKPVKAKGYINGGDLGEANSRKWPDRFAFVRNPRELVEENAKLLKEFKAGKGNLRELTLKMTNDAMGGSVENMSVILDWVADYMEGIFNPTIENSELKQAFVCVQGNHTYDIFKDLGLRDWDFFKQRLTARGMPVFESGVPKYVAKYAKVNPEKARAYFGGYSNALAINIPNYGVDASGKFIFGPEKHGPINLYVQHNPKGGGDSGLIGAGKNANADLSLAGHTHEQWLKLYSTGDNTFSVAYRLATMQGVTPTEKLYASSVPRTCAGQRFIMPKPGYFFEETLPAPYLRKKGEEVLEQKLAGAK